MEFLHEELRRAREQAGLTQQALADKAGIPRNQIVRAERGENITVETLRKIAAYLPVTQLTLLDSTTFRVAAIPEPERLFLGALKNVLYLSEALSSAINLTLEAGAAVEASHQASPLPEGMERPGTVDVRLLLRLLKKIAGDIEDVGRQVRIA